MLFVLGLVALTSQLALAGSAADGPGALSHFDLARKDCLGTAPNRASKVWFTVAGGILSDVYFPTNDNTNVETLQYVVTDGSTFTDIQSRDTTYTAEALDPRALDCRVTATARNGKYRIITDYFTDPDHHTVVIHSKFQPLVGQLSSYQLYAIYNPSINGNGGGNAGNGGADSATVDTSTGHDVLIASDTVTATNAVKRDYAVPVYSALDASIPFIQVTNGFVDAASDPLVQLQSSNALTTLYSDASTGNVVQGAQVDLRHGGDFVLALGFGTTQAAAVNAAEATLRAKIKNLQNSYEDAWHDYDAGLKAPPARLAGVSGTVWKSLVDGYYLNANLLKASQDKTFPGALQAAPAAPWGQAISAGDPGSTYFGSYREVFARDLYHQWTGLMADGDTQTAANALHFLFFNQQLPDGSMPRNSLPNGELAPDSFGTQLDECSFPIIMAYQMGLTGAGLYTNHIAPAANYIASHGPAFGAERWEEQGGYSPSTIAAEIAALIAAADIAKANSDTKSAAVWRGIADDWQRSLKGWTVTTNGSLASHPYFLRLSKSGDPNAAISYNLGNGGPTLDQRDVVDAGFLELVRLGILPADDSDILNSLPVIDSNLLTQTPSGPGWHRYTGDGYGDFAGDGHPWAPTGRGTGHVWPILTGERGEYAIDTGDMTAAVQMLRTMNNFSSGIGLIPEQDWELPDLLASPFGTDPTLASIGFQDGHPAGSAAPRYWAAGQYLRLLQGVVNNRVVERPAATYSRYVAHSQGQTTLTVATPLDHSAVFGSPVFVNGVSVPGNRIYISATNTDNNSQTTIVNSPTASDGSFSVPVPLAGGNTVLNIVAVSPTGATAHVERAVFFDFTPGTVLLDVSDPSGDDNGPGNYAYPSFSDFHAGAYDITEFQVILSPDSSTVTFKLQLRDLTPTFGSPLGAQLVDVYVHDPSAAPADTSTAAAFPVRNYVIAAGSAWSRLLEVQGFGQQYTNAHGNALGTIDISASSISRFITFSVPTSTLGGQPGSGWGFNVVVTGEDGFSTDFARAFTATPQAFTFGVCAAASADAHCTANPNTVPKLIDVLTPAGVLQSDELDYTIHSPVTLQGVAIP